MPTASSGATIAVKPQIVHFYRKQGKIHIRETAGRYNRLRWGMVFLTQLIFYGLCWLPWQGRQAVLFDIANRKFYIFDLILWPQDAVYLAAILMMAAFGLFFFTAVAGRVFCGFACPQTVYTAMFAWIEARVEGNHLARIKLDQQPWHVRKLARKALKHGAWIGVSLVTGMTFVGYFTPIRDLVAGMPALLLGPWEGFWLLFYAVFTYLQAGILREQVCQHMCPYSRFQGVMFDPDTLTVSYDAARGEPRGGHQRRQAVQGAVKPGDCVDCGICVQVCPAGIDIRHGLQYECIGCGLCVDACNTVMDKLERPRGLIRYASERMLSRGEQAMRLFRPRVALYGALLIGLTIGSIWLLIHRMPLRVDVIRDRLVLMRELGDGRVENSYTLHIHNQADKARYFKVEVSGLPGLTLAEPEVVEVAAGSSYPLPVSLSVDKSAGHGGANPIVIAVRAMDQPGDSASQISSFILP
ncbi:cytochrome c oxidase accessory protein CcoG [Chitinivorax sp. B]|uniref:cytochrome c oxidase accessory protein CcoG n=1 Tax=Chitinivorax sp. B TaxID=2502235 RepID=UPI0010F9238C|nr:cytochrome c oxidase accessory protein CcoG [Chitinivorax sp. B]